MTSHDVVNIIRRLSGQRRVGHAGTLDPAAEGVLVLCLGKATKVVEYLVDDRKTYRAEITLGVSTDTFDAEGRITARSDALQVSIAAVAEALTCFRGTIAQIPPVYSAIKRGGQPLYKLARAGIDVVPEPRQVSIYTLEIIGWQSPVVTICVECSKGTYIRSLAHDLGQRLGCGAHLSRLLRLRSGCFSLDTASTIKELEVAFAGSSAEDLLFDLDWALLSYNALIVGPGRTSAVRNGMGWVASIHPDEGPVGDKGPVRVYSPEGEIVAMVSYDHLADRWQPQKVF